MNRLNELLKEIDRLKALCDVKQTQIEQRDCYIAELQATQAKLDSLREYLKSEKKYQQYLYTPNGMSIIFKFSQDILNRLEGKEQ